MYDPLLKELEQRSWSEQDQDPELFSNYISQLIGFLVMLTIIFTNDLWMFSGVFLSINLADKNKLAFNLTETVRGLFQVYNADNEKCIR